MKIKVFMMRCSKVMRAGTGNKNFFFTLRLVLFDNIVFVKKSFTKIKKYISNLISLSFSYIGTIMSEHWVSILLKINKNVNNIFRFCRKIQKFKLLIHVLLKWHIDFIFMRHKRKLLTYSGWDFYVQNTDGGRVILPPG